MSIQQAPEDKTPEKIIFDALDLIEAHSIQGCKSDGLRFEWAYMLPEAIDWQQFRAMALHDMEPLKTITMTDAAGIIDRALMRLQDGHSMITSPDYIRNLDPSYVDKITWISHKELYHKRPESAAQASYVQPMPKVRLKDDILHVTVPGFLNTEEASRLNYQHLLRDGLITASCQKLQGVVVDLRLNYGGSMVPMIAGLSPLLGPDVLGFFQGPSKESSNSWSVNYGVFPDEQIDLKDAAYFPDTPIAVIAGPGTCSSGEITFLGFRGRPHTQSFGASTFGNASGNSAFLLTPYGKLSYPFTPGGSVGLHLCTTVALDRNGQGSGNGIKRLDGGKIRPDVITDQPLEQACQWLADGALPLRPAAENKHQQKNALKL